MRLSSSFIAAMLLIGNFVTPVQAMVMSKPVAHKTVLHMPVTVKPIQHMSHRALTKAVRATWKPKGGNAKATGY